MHLLKELTLSQTIVERITFPHATCLGQFQSQYKFSRIVRICGRFPHFETCFIKPYYNHVHIQCWFINKLRVRFAWRVRNARCMAVPWANYIINWSSICSPALAEEILELANILEASTCFALVRLLIFSTSLLIYQIGPVQCMMCCLLINRQRVKRGSMNHFLSNLLDILFSIVLP